MLFMAGTGGEGGKGGGGSNPGPCCMRLCRLNLILNWRCDRPEEAQQPSGSLLASFS